MNPYVAYFKACKLYWKTYYIWKTNHPNIREYQLKLAKRDVEIARALMNVERKKVQR